MSESDSYISRLLYRSVRYHNIKFYSPGQSSFPHRTVSNQGSMLQNFFKSDKLVCFIVTNKHIKPSLIFVVRERNERVSHG